METKPFGGFSLKTTEVQSSSEREDRKNDDPEIKSMVEEEPDYPDPKTTMNEIQKKALAWKNQ